MSKGRKPKKPLSPKTAALLAQLERRRGVRNLQKRFLIVCEDEKSSRNYFEALKRHFNLSAGSIRVADSSGHTQPVQVVERAIDIKKNAASPNSGTLPFEQVWCVIDGDYGCKIANARHKADANGVELAISTMCFEYWVLLHFEENDKSTIDCDGVVRTLKRNIFPGTRRVASTSVRSLCAYTMLVNEPNNCEDGASRVVMTFPKTKTPAAKRTSWCTQYLALSPRTTRQDSLPRPRQL